MLPAEIILTYFLSYLSSSLFTFFFKAFNLFSPFLQRFTSRIHTLPYLWQLTNSLCNYFIPPNSHFLHPSRPLFQGLQATFLPSCAVPLLAFKPSHSYFLPSLLPAQIFCSLPSFYPSPSPSLYQDHQASSLHLRSHITVSTFPISTICWTRKSVVFSTHSLFILHLSFLSFYDLHFPFLA